jgi:hypothetical protein
MRVPVAAIVSVAMLVSTAPAAAGVLPTAETPTAGSASPSGLPDGRAYELVSALPYVGEPYDPPLGAPATTNTTQLPFQASEDGEAVAYAGEPGSTGGNGETGSGEGNEWLARRESTGWTTKDITPEGAEGFYEAFTFPGGVPRGYLEAGNENFTSKSDCRDLYSVESGATFRPLFAPPAGSEHCHPLFAGASAGDVAVLFQAEGALTPDAQEAEQPSEREIHSGGDGPSKACMYSCNLYLAEGERLTLVNKLDGKDVPNANFGGFPLPPFPIGRLQTDLSNVISRDGSRIFWTDTQEGEHQDQIFMFTKGQNVPISKGRAEYWTATPDGRYAYYTENGVLRRFDADSEGSISLTPSEAGVLGVLGVNETGEDGAYLYFVATAVLSSNKDGQGLSAQEGEPNIYVMRKTGNGEFTTDYVATLSRQQDDTLQANTAASNPTGGDWRPDLGERTSEVSPDGRSLMFESVNPLTGYDNTPESGSPVPEVFIYDAANAELSCVSCDPSGRKPAAEGEAFTDLPISSEGRTYEHRWMSNNGNRAFFQSEQSLTPQVTNPGTWNVYEWEREGEGSCSAVVPARSLGGCIYVLSGGYGSADAFLVESDANGSNVFFVHRGGLGEIAAPNERNEIYDARVDGGFPRVSLACAGTGCQGVPPAPPVFATPASVTFTGGGNFSLAPRSASKKLLPKRKTKCVKGKKRNKHRQCVESRKKARTRPPGRAAADRRARR